MTYEYAALWCEYCDMEFVTRDYEPKWLEVCPVCDTTIADRNVKNLTVNEYGFAKAEGIEEI